MSERVFLGLKVKFHQEERYGREDKEGAKRIKAGPIAISS